MTTSVQRGQLQQLPHLNVQAIGDRTMNLMSMWDGEKWNSWVPVGEKLVKMQMVGLVEGDYLAKAAELPSDLFIPFVDLMWQRASWPEIVPLINGIEEDFRNMGTSISKLKHIFRTQDLLPANSARAFAATELEYLIILCRTVFDLLQEMMSHIWHTRVRLHDPLLERRRKAGKLPDRFSRLCLREKVGVRSAEEIQQTFGLPKEMAETYALSAPFFLELRNLRNAIVHGGTGVDCVFDTDKGFCIHKDSHLLKAVPCKFSHEFNENLVSILPWLSTVILNTIGTCTSLINAFASLIPLPPEIAPGYRVFVRGPNNSALLEVLEINNGGSPWWKHVG